MPSCLRERAARRFRPRPCLYLAGSIRGDVRPPARDRSVYRHPRKQRLRTWRAATHSCARAAIRETKLCDKKSSPIFPRRLIYDQDLERLVILCEQIMKCVDQIGSTIQGRYHDRNSLPLLIHDWCDSRRKLKLRTAPHLVPKECAVLVLRCPGHSKNACANARKASQACNRKVPQQRKHTRCSTGTIRRT